MATPIGYTPPQPVTIAPWLQPLVQRESGGNWGAVNSGGYSGFLQFGEAALQDAGVYRPGSGGRWSGTFNLPSGQYDYQGWLASPRAQMESADAWFGLNAQRIREAGLDRYIGQTVNGIPITHEGLLYGAHLGGFGGLKSWLEGGGDRRDANGTRISDYVAMGAQASGAPPLADMPPPRNPPQQGPGGPQHMGILDALAGTPPQQPRDRRGLLDALLYGIEDDSQRQGLMGMAAAMMQAGAPSTDPRSGSLMYGIGRGLEGAMSGQRIGGEMDDRNALRDARAQTEAMIAGLPAEIQGLARMDPTAFARIMLERQFAGPPEPISVGGHLVDPSTYQTIWQPPEEPTTAVQNLLAAGIDPQSPEGQAALLRAAGGAGVTVNNQGSIPSGYRLVTSPDGREQWMEPIPGSPAALEQQAAADAAQAQQALTARSGGIVLDEINRAMGLLDENVNFTAGPGASVGMLWPSSPASQLNSLLETVKANIGFDRLQQMREASPTGGALGAVSDRELGTLQAVSGTLDITGDPQMLQENLQRLWNAYMDAIHGTPDQIRALGAQRGMSEQEIEQLTYRYPAPAGAGRGVPALPGGTMPAAPSVQGGAYPAAADIGRMTPSDLQGLLPLINDQMPPDLLRAIERRMDELGM